MAVATVKGASLTLGSQTLKLRSVLFCVTNISSFPAASQISFVGPDFQNLWDAGVVKGEGAPGRLRCGPLSTLTPALTPEFIYMYIKYWEWEAGTDLELKAQIKIWSSLYKVMRTLDSDLKTQRLKVNVGII